MLKIQFIKKGFTLFTPLVGVVILVISLVMIVNIINIEKTRVNIIIDYQSSLKESATIDFAKIDAIHTIMFEYKNQLHNMFLKKYFNDNLAGAIDVSRSRFDLCTVLKDFIETDIKTEMLTNMSSNVFNSTGSLKNVDSSGLTNMGDYSLGLFGSFTNYNVTFLPSDCFSSEDGSFAVEIKPINNMDSNTVARIMMINNLTGEKNSSFIIPDEGLIIPLPFRFIKAADIAISIQEKLFDSSTGIKSWGVCDLKSSNCGCELKNSGYLNCKIHSEANYFGEKTRLDCKKDQSIFDLEGVELKVSKTYYPKNQNNKITDFEKNCLDSSYDGSDVYGDGGNYASNEITTYNYMNNIKEIISGVLLEENSKLGSGSNMEFSPLFFTNPVYMAEVEELSGVQVHISENDLSKVVFPTKYFEYTVDDSSFRFEGCSDRSYVKYFETNRLKPALCAQMPKNAKLCFSLVDKGIGIPGRKNVSTFEAEKEEYFVYHSIKYPMGLNEEYATRDNSGGVSVPFVFCVSLANVEGDPNFVLDKERDKLKEQWAKVEIGNGTSGSLPFDMVGYENLKCFDYANSTSSSCDICNDLSDGC